MTFRGRKSRLSVPGIGSVSVAVLVPTLIWSVAASAAPAGNSAATISGSFADSCRDFTARSSKDISHVEIQYADGHAVKDETITIPDYALDAGVGDEIEVVIVKSGTTSERFVCVQENGPPTALLEVNTPDVCFTLADGLVDCAGDDVRTTWTRSYVPTLGYGLVRFGCGINGQGPCLYTDCEFVFGTPQAPCSFTYSFRGVSSSDPDDDIVSWSIDFGDGTSVSGDWAANPPTDISHDYPLNDWHPATLTVTDSAGHSASDAQFVFHVFPD